MDDNPLSPTVQNNPYPYYAALRDKAQSSSLNMRHNEK
jgi:hypothetical protein